MKIYTKKGDSGFTDLINKRVSKDDLAIWVNGTLDELSGYLAYSKTHIKNNDILAIIDNVINDIYLISYEIAGGPLQINNDKISQLENLIDKYNNLMPKLTKFIVFDKKKGSSLLNICRTLTRKSERLVVGFKEQQKINENIIIYLNRLSDLLFVLARYLDL